MNSRETESPHWRAQSLIAGMNMATTGVLLRNALSAATGTTIFSWAWAMERGRPHHRWAMRWMAPVSRSPAPTTNRMATVTMPGLDSPASASAGVSTPLTNSSVSPPTSTMSGGMWVKTSSPSTIASTARVVQASQATAQPPFVSNRLNRRGLRRPLVYHAPPGSEIGAGGPGASRHAAPPFETGPPCISAAG